MRECEFSEFTFLVKHDCNGSICWMQCIKISNVLTKQTLNWIQYRWILNLTSGEGELSNTFNCFPWPSDRFHFLMLLNSVMPLSIAYLFHYLLKIYINFLLILWSLYCKDKKFIFKNFGYKNKNLQLLPFITCLLTRQGNTRFQLWNDILLTCYLKICVGLVGTPENLISVICLMVLSSIDKLMYCF